jgi:hypothetical protein
VAAHAGRHPDRLGVHAAGASRQGLFNEPSRELHESGRAVAAVVWDNPMLKRKVRG